MWPSSSPWLAARFGGRPGILDLRRGDMALLDEAGEDLAEEVVEEEALLLLALAGDAAFAFVLAVQRDIAAGWRGRRPVGLEEVAGVFTAAIAGLQLKAKVSGAHARAE